MPSPDPRRAITLSAVLDRDAIAVIVPKLSDALAAGQLSIDGSAVERVGQAGLQLLLSARRSAEANGAPFAVLAPSQPLCRAARIAGLTEALSLPDAE